MKLHGTTDAPIDLRKLMDEARAEWWRQWANEHFWPVVVAALSKPK